MHRHRPLAFRSTRRPIIALALLAIVCSGAAATSDEAEDALTAMSLPALANTSEGDRPLLREIGDEHVHDGAFAVASPVPGDVSPTDDVWARVRASGRFDIPDNESVQAQVRALRDQALWIGKILHRGTPFVAHVLDALDARYLPLELTLLPAIESGFRPRAVSSERAAGLWQLMPDTAREIGVERGEWYDGRADVVRSTTAALDYLSYLNAEFHGNWELTLAAYNAGPGRVRQALRKNRRAGLPEDFWSLPLPSETRAYVPKVLALLAFLRDDGGAGLDVPHVPLEPAFVKIDAGRRISIERAARLGRVSESLLRRLNGGLVHGVTPPEGPHTLYVPWAARSAFVSRLAAVEPGPLFSPPGSHEVVAGDTLGGLALVYGIAEERLMALNGLDDTRIRIGQRLALREPPVTSTLADGPAGVEHVVASGDTLSDIARRYDVGLDDITDREGRRLQADVIHPGDTLFVRTTSAGAG